MIVVQYIAGGRYMTEDFEEMSDAQEFVERNAPDARIIMVNGEYL